MPVGSYRAKVIIYPELGSRSIGLTKIVINKSANMTIHSLTRVYYSGIALPPRDQSRKESEIFGQSHLTILNRLSLTLSIRL